MYNYLYIYIYLFIYVLILLQSALKEATGVKILHTRPLRKLAYILLFIALTLFCYNLTMFSRCNNEFDDDNCYFIFKTF